MRINQHWPLLFSGLSNGCKRQNERAQLAKIRRYDHHHDQNYVLNLSSGGPATIDDISVFVIPVLPYKQEVLAAKTRELEEEEEGREAMEVEEERANSKVTVMEVEEEKVNSTDTGEVCDTKEEPVVNGEEKNEEVAEKEEEVSCDQTSQPLDLAK